MQESFPSSTSSLTSGMPPPDQVLSVSDLNRLARVVLEQSFPLCWVSGEISNLTRAASGHWYFSLKDDKAQVRCVMFKHKAVYVDWFPKEGDRVEARALISLYEARGDFQLTIEQLRKAGLGSLFEAFEALKQKLQLEGLFDRDLKRSIPKHPSTIGIITSPDAAALRDILSTLKRRMPTIRVILYPTPVQGKTAHYSIAKAIEEANTRQECDVLILARGGGSLEDLWSFNEELVARAVAGSAIPIISGVGHETDFTICDFVADARAATPTAAAELVSPDREQLIRQLRQKHEQLRGLIRFGLQTRMQHIDYLSRRLISPKQQLMEKKNRLLVQHQRLQITMQTLLSKQSSKLNYLKNSLKHLNPHEVLGRGYAMIKTQKDHHLIASANTAQHGQRIIIQWSDGEKEAVIDVLSDYKKMQKPLF